VVRLMETELPTMTPPRDRQATGFAWIRSTRGARRPNHRRHSASHPAPLDLSTSGVIIVELSLLIPRSLAALGGITCHSYAKRVPRSLAALGGITCHSYAKRVSRSLAALGKTSVIVTLVIPVVSPLCVPATAEPEELWPTAPTPL